MMRAIALTVIALVVFPWGVAAQAPPPPGNGLVEFGKKTIAVFQKPIHPILETVAPGGWLGAGLGYNTQELWNNQAFASLKGVYTIRQYWNTQANFGLQGTRYRVESYARARDMKRLPLNGLGNDTEEADATTFRLLDREIGGIGSVRFGAVAVGGRIESLWPELEEGQSKDVPSFEQRFTEETLPGLTVQPHFAHYETFVNVNYPYDLNARGFTGGDYRLAFSYVRDGEQDLYSFRRLTGEVQQRIPGFRDDQRLTLHGLISTSYTPTGNTVPFYFQGTLGGAGSVRAVNDEIIGTDGSKATLRGFNDLRFRGPHLLLLQGEYRWTVWGPIDATAFVDAGKVTLSRSDLDLTDLEHDYGGSLSLMTGDATALRVDFGFGGGEGAHVFFSIGPIFAQ
jgi:hypothetical protein